MKKFFALLLAVAMLLTGTIAMAETVNISFTTNPQVMQQALTQWNASQNDITQFSKILAVLQMLKINGISADNGAQVDVNVAGQTVTLAGWGEDDVLMIGSSLFPSYVLKITEDDVQKFMQNVSASIPGGASIDPEAIQALGQKVYGYIMGVAPSVMGAISYGTPEAASLTVENYTFDTKTPINVDTKVIGEAVKKLVNDLMNDPDIVSLIKNAGQVDPAQIIASVNEGMDNQMPEVKVDVYTIGGQQMPFYAVSEATNQGAQDPFLVFKMLMREDNTGSIAFEVPAQNMTLAVDFSESAARIAVIGAEEGQYAGFAFSWELVNGKPAKIEIGMYLADRDNPVASMLIDIAEGGETTFPMTSEGKTLISLIDLIGELSNNQYSEGTQQFLQEIMQNPLMQMVSGM